MSLKSALAKLEVGDLAAVPLLLEVWRKTPDPRLAEVLDGLNSRINRPPVPTASQKKATEAFLELVKKKDPLDLPRMVAVIGTTRSAQMIEQLEAMLDTWPADPRVTRPFILLLKNPPFTGSSTQSAWRRLYKLLQQYSDPRLITELGALDFAALFREANTFRPQGVDENAFAASFFSERATAVLTALTKKYAKGVPKFDAAEDATIARLLELARPTPEAALIKEVQAAPGSAGAREVLADHLLEKNDVRGHFMALQNARAQGTMTPAMAKEESKLLEQYALQWVGALAPLLKEEGLYFERGFLAQCTLDCDRVGLVKDFTGNPLWSTVKRIDLYGHSFPRELLIDPAMKSLTSVTGIHEEVGRKILAAEHTYPWTEVGISLPDYDLAASDVELLAKNLKRVFPRLTSLQLLEHSAGPDSYAFLWTPEFAQLKKFTMARGQKAIPRFLKATARAPKEMVLEVIDYRHQGSEFRLRPGPSGDRTVLELASRSVPGRYVTSLAELAKAATPLAKTLTTIRVFTRCTKADRASLEALLVPGGKLELVTV